jgi:hypothetical protein
LSQAPPLALLDVVFRKEQIQVDLMTILGRCSPWSLFPAVGEGRDVRLTGTDAAWSMVALST